MGGFQVIGTLVSRSLLRWFACLLVCKNGRAVIIITLETSRVIDKRETQGLRLDGGPVRQNRFFAQHYQTAVSQIDDAGGLFGICCRLVSLGFSQSLERVMQPNAHG